MFDLREESARLASRTDVDWEALSGARVLVTGATGLIGSHCVRALLERNRACGAHVEVRALVRDLDKASTMLAGYGPEDGLEYIEGDLLDVGLASLGADLVVHTACPTASRFFAQHPVQTAEAIVTGTGRMLQAARLHGASAFVYLSSMEAYGNGNAAPGLSHLLTEADVGYVDPMAPRSCYPEGKRMAEQLCCAYACQYGLPAKVVRLAQTFGPGIPKADTRVFAQFARCALAGEDILLKTTGESTRMYLYTTDAVRAVLTVLVAGEGGQAYNAANPRTYSSVRQMAELVATHCAQGRIQVRVEVDPDAPYPPEHHLPLDVSRLQALGWEADVDLPEMYDNLMAYLGEEAR